jgi:glycosyltransferase involved in cell wall biosynthesis
MLKIVLYFFVLACLLFLISKINPQIMKPSKMEDYEKKPNLQASVTYSSGKSATTNSEVRYDLICFSHLRWDFVYQRPQHLISRFAKNYRVFFVEEPMFDTEEDYLEVGERDKNLYVVIPHIKGGGSEEVLAKQIRLLDEFFVEYKIDKYKFWYYTPMALAFSSHYSPDLIIYDCMDELSAFKFAPEELKNFENELFYKSDIVFTGGNTLYESKKHKHSNIHPFPSSIDKHHFEQARQVTSEPADQKNIPHPRLGFYGVVDERFDINLIKEMAEKKPDWHFVILGPVVKIDPASLPSLPNTHFLGSKNYKELPDYVGGWDIALIPFLINDSTKFISPTKTPEYLAAGKPVISTPINDVIHPYDDEKLVSIGTSADEFIAAAEKELERGHDKTWLAKVDHFLADNSWDQTWNSMAELIKKTLNNKNSNN